MELLGNILVAIITGSFAFFGVVYSNRKQNDVNIECIKSEVKLIQNDITNLEKKQDKHNTLIERMYAVEKSIGLLEEKQKIVVEKLDNIEKRG